MRCVVFAALVAAVHARGRCRPETRCINSPDEGLTDVSEFFMPTNATAAEMAIYQQGVDRYSVQGSVGRRCLSYQCRLRARCSCLPIRPGVASFTLSSTIAAAATRLPPRLLKDQEEPGAELKVRLIPPRPPAFCHHRSDRRQRSVCLSVACRLLISELQEII